MNVWPPSVLRFDSGVYASLTVDAFPSLRWPQLRRVLEAPPLRYKVVSERGSHKKLQSDAGYPELRLAFHDNDDLPPGLVRKILVKDVGLPVEEARSLV